MKSLAVSVRKPYGFGVFSRVRHARYLGWEDAFEVEFEDGLCFLESGIGVKRANRIGAQALPVRVEVDPGLGSHFKVTYDNGQIAEVSWAFVREHPPKKPRKAATKKSFASSRLAPRRA